MSERSIEDQLKTAREVNKQLVVKLNEADTEIQRLRAANEHLNREAAAIHDSERHWIQRNKQTNEELIWLRAALQDYGGHSSACGLDYGDECTCGFRKALKGEKADADG